MALVDSESAFRKRCEQLQVSLAEKAEAQSLNTFSTFAFAVGSPPKKSGELCRDHKTCRYQFMEHPHWGTLQQLEGFILSPVPIFSLT